MRKTREYACPDCREAEDHLIDDKEDYENLTFDCGCGSIMKYRISMNQHGFNTTKMSQSFVDGLKSRKAEMAGHKARRKLEKTISSAKKNFDMETVVAASKESKDAGLGARGSIIK